MSQIPQPMDRAALERIARVFATFSDATRLAILQELKNGPQTVGQLVHEIGGSQGNVSKQLQLLFDAGLLEREKKGNQVFYAICDNVVFDLCKLACDKLNRDSAAAVEFSFEI